MSRIQTVDPKSATGETRALFDAAHAKLGTVPNFLRVLGHSPRALTGFLNLYGALDDATLDRATRERIALVVAEGNSCEYRLSAHTAIPATRDFPMTRYCSTARAAPQTRRPAPQWLSRRQSTITRQK